MESNLWLRAEPIPALFAQTDHSLANVCANVLYFILIYTNKFARV